jgi:hypothetical protein
VRAVGLSARQALSATGWVICAVLLALGSAGVVSGLDHRPGTLAREELTWPGDRAVLPVLQGAAADLEQIAAEVDRLSLLGRGVLSAITARDSALLETTLNEGRILAAGIELRVAAVRSTLEGLPGFGTGSELRLGDQARTTRAVILAGLAATTGLTESWAILASGGLTAAHLSDLLEEHDESALAAIDAGFEGRYEDALGRLAEAEASLEEAGRLRDQLRNTVDVGTLDEWLRRNTDYDAALRQLYSALVASGGRATAEVRDAIRAEETARERLPPDARGIAIIVAEIGRGGANQAVIEIELVRGALAGALEDLRAAPGIAGA